MSVQTAILEIPGIRFETLKALDAKAQKFGKTVEEYTRDLIEQDVSSNEMTFDEILAPIRAEVEASGITDEELDELFMQARRDYYLEQKGRD